MIICTCSHCILKRCTDEDGNSRPDQFVSRETQLKHHRTDLKDSQDDSSRSRKSSPEHETDNLEDLLKKQEGLDYEALTQII
ncbi:hypothetical protein CROQUDRAFT_655637 [Cronartium quercuum f. sp. fusiforme G11]|uniref:Uncharacterized protein n=1 Tax=Cronartium quercuum f. sp. fusiforme G11 TaxID=708437 RepID=A0A9P6NPE6_9BASI|nr:hypothetical protein CROQUDRAFT_655637 [Cronartium quercuum f. sp. fusiforme G11]